MKSIRFLIINLLVVVVGLNSIPSTAQEKTHTIKSGETLSSIAKKYKTTVGELQRLNPETKSGIRAGATLVIGGKEKQEMPNAAPSMDAKVHTVKTGESLSRIARRYNVSVADLEKWNGITPSSLKAGSDLVVSSPDKGDRTDSPHDASKFHEEVISEAGSHTVTQGQTLSSIASEHKISVTELKKINGLKTNSIGLGQVLKVPAAGKVTEGNEPKELRVSKQKPLANEIKPEVKTEAKVQIQTATVVSQEADQPKATVVQEKEIAQEDPSKSNSGSIKEVNNTLGYTRVVETGFAEAIESEGSSKKHLCLHKSAPIGTILQVKNEINGQSVFVKVIGKLPETGSNEKLVIRISRQAYDKLMASGKRFPVEVSYPLAQ